MKRFFLVLYVSMAVLFICNEAIGQEQYNIEVGSKTFINSLSTFTPDGGVVFCAQQYGLLDSYNVSIVKLNQYNKIEWVKEIHGYIQDLEDKNSYPRDNKITALAALPDNGFIATTYGNKRGVIMRLNHLGELLWAKSFFKEKDWDLIRPEAVKIVHDEILIAGSIGSSPANYTWHFFSSLSFSGDVNYFKVFNKSDSVYFIRQIQLDEQGNIFIATDNKTLISLIDINGERVHALFSSQFPAINYSKIALSKDSVLITGFFNNKEGGGLFVMKVSKDLKAGVINAVFINPVGGHSAFIFEPQEDGLVYLSGTASYLPALYKVSPFEEKIHWGYQYEGDEGVSVSHLHSDKGASILVTGLYHPGIMTGGSLFMLKSDSIGNGCVDSNLSLKFEQRQYNTIRGTASLLDHDFGLVNREVTVRSVSSGIIKPICYSLPPTVGFDVSKPVICTGQEVHLTNNTLRGENWYWRFEGAHIDTFIGETPPPLRYDSAGIFPITLVAENSLGTSTMTRTITIVQSPQATASDDTFFCEGNAPIRLSVSGGDSYRWYTSTQNNISTDSVYYASPDNSTMYYVEASNSAGCTDVDSVQVLVYQKPSETGYDTSICQGDTLVLVADVGDFTYQWSNGSDDDRINVTETGKYSVTATNQCFSSTCTYNISVIDCDLYFNFPTAFTPNGDGRNDSFSVIGENMDVFRLEIYNRWGECIFKTQDVRAAWDGTFKGELCPEGMYFYIFSLQGTHKGYRESSGKFLLLR